MKRRTTIRQVRTRVRPSRRTGWDRVRPSNGLVDQYMFWFLWCSCAGGGVSWIEATAGDLNICGNNFYILFVCLAFYFISLKYNNSLEFNSMGQLLRAADDTHTYTHTVHCLSEVCELVRRRSTC